MTAKIHHSLCFVSAGDDDIYNRGCGLIFILLQVLRGRLCGDHQ